MASTSPSADDFAVCRMSRSYSVKVNLSLSYSETIPFRTPASMYPTRKPDWTDKWAHSDILVTRSAPRRRPGASFLHAILATTFFRCWHLLLFFGAWSSLITVLNNQGQNITIEPTLLTGKVFFLPYCHIQMNEYYPGLVQSLVLLCRIEPRLHSRDTMKEGGCENCPRTSCSVF